MLFFCLINIHMTGVQWILLQLYLIFVSIFGVCSQLYNVTDSYSNKFFQ